MPVEENNNPISQAYIRSIIAMDRVPVLRNLKITQAYFDLSQAIAQRLGDTNANWCNIATWASKTAGRFIRMEDLNVHLHKLLHAHDDYNDWLGMIQDKFRDLEIDHEFDHSRVHHAAHNVITEISADIAAGEAFVIIVLRGGNDHRDRKGGCRRRAGQPDRAIAESRAEQGGEGDRAGPPMTRLPRPLPHGIGDGSELNLAGVGVNDEFFDFAKNLVLSITHGGAGYFHYHRLFGGVIRCFLRRLGFLSLGG